LYSLETADDLGALRQMLHRHRDSSGRPPCLGMNFVVANLDFKKMAGDGFRAVHLIPLTEGLPEGWERPGLIDAYRDGIAEGVFYPALHGTTHFCRSAVERNLAVPGDRSDLLRLLWRAGTPYIHWRMPWIGYEYWDPEKPEDDRFLAADLQQDLIGLATGIFAKLFSTLPRSACAPGYRANDDTQRAWAKYGIRVAQNGPGRLTPPYVDGNGILQLSRTVDFEPATNPEVSLKTCIQTAEDCFARGIPAIVSVHSINFHSAIEDFRGGSLQRLDQYLSALEAKHPDLLYLHDQDIDDLVRQGSYETAYGPLPVSVTRKSFTRAEVARQNAS